MRVSFLVFSAALSGCVSTNTYSVPRTLAPDESSHTVAVEMFEAKNACVSNTPCQQGAREFLLATPVYMGRRGIVESLDVGVTLAANAAVDLKWQVVRSTHFDLAVAPAVAGPFVFAVHAPVLVGVNLTDWLTVVLLGGWTMLLTEQDVQVPLSDRNAFHAKGSALRLGGGIDVRIPGLFALHPEVSWLRFREQDGTVPTLLTFGFGFRFGA